MAYAPTTWTDGVTVANATTMGNIENGIVAADPTKAISTAMGTWLNGATDGVGSTTASARFAATWRNGICIMHIDLKRGTSTDIVGTLDPSTPPPPVLVEIQTDQASGGYVFIYGGSRDVHAYGSATGRYEANLTWLY